ncbi:hypothetical protein GLOIN_2v1470518 [Rhizophagus irregularis DAOM 181602=DAOM 197198]|uniref:Uncharacterized protein n=1 Tax=Rhizophagus irregularis (strain DAOM 181602 / DAOM 197198 / MUCL 43194) TaxID=747089 RepID=A0A2P4QVK6_RHIID|nr:hypothetical protein GLOIN_2v1470518 [Rhizophagus irregularis DAOM 181602=DAOM 197198]POG81681.1 hypothetical protein GLOIN_2v1470518 [Rhizophagus irregularis DAOM 181602=DAOM 197198]|eukprot:XP_025188547.1 hypothetical protein GLOIN_2v1470518 [Rhizophagus irregularis DAOM 181602=DAOM 197198]
MVTESIEDLTQKNEYDNAVVSWLCQCSNIKKTKTYSPESFREYLEKNPNNFLMLCLSCNELCPIFNVYLIIYYLKFLFRDGRCRYKVCGIWACQSCEYSNERETTFNVGMKSFKSYLEKANDFFWEKCLKCRNKCQISSFHLLKKKSSKFEELCSITEIVRNLIDNNKYQIYGYWLCRLWKCRHELQCKSGFNCRYKWYSQHKWQCQHEPKCNGPWSMFQCRNKECKCLVKRDWKCKDLRLNGIELHCEKNFCRCKQYHDSKCKDNWLNKNKWQCQHVQKCKTERECKRDWLCLNELKSEKYTQELLKKHLKKSPSEQYEFFRKDCKECGKSGQISSFQLYTPQENALYEDESEGSKNPSLAPIPAVDICSPLESTSLPAGRLTEIQTQTPTVEIVCHLVWNNHYRVFGEWMCRNHCYRTWPSSYTWIKLHKFIDKFSVENLNRNDFYMQSCKKCEQPGNRLLKYEHLKEAEEISHHKRYLCKKCRYGQDGQDGEFIQCRDDSIDSSMCVAQQNLIIWLGSSYRLDKSRWLSAIKNEKVFSGGQ